MNRRAWQTNLGSSGTCLCVEQATRADGGCWVCRRRWRRLSVGALPAPDFRGAPRHAAEAAAEAASGYYDVLLVADQGRRAAGATKGAPHPSRRASQLFSPGVLFFPLQRRTDWVARATGTLAGGQVFTGRGYASHARRVRRDAVVVGATGGDFCFASINLST